LVRTVLVAQARGGYKRVPLVDIVKADYTRGRKTLWGKRRRFWVPKEAPQNWRVTMGMSWVWSKEYRSTTYSKEFDHEPNSVEIDEMKKDFWVKMEEKVGYPKTEWWFDDEITMEVAQIPDREYSGKEAFWTDMSSKPSQEKIKKDVAKMAKNFIASGRWFKKHTLDKWLGLLG